MVKTMTDSSTLSTHDPAFIVSAPTDYDMLAGTSSAHAPTWRS